MSARMWIATIAAVLIPLSVRAEVDKKTERTWKAKCASCHGADGKGQTDLGQKAGTDDYTSPAWQKAHTDARIKTAIENGVKRETGGKQQEMDGFSLRAPTRRARTAAPGSTGTRRRSTPRCGRRSGRAE